jgi:hypothetical protein
VTGEFLSALIDKEALLIEGLWCDAVFADIGLKELRCFPLKLYEAEAVAFAQDGQCFLLRIKVIQIEGGNFTRPCPGIKKEMKKGIIPETLLSSQIDGLKDFEDFLLIQKPDERFSESLLWNVDDPFSQVALFGVDEADHFGKGLERSEAQIAGSGKVVSLIVELIEEGDDQLW